MRGPLASVKRKALRLKMQYNPDGSHGAAFKMTSWPRLFFVVFLAVVASRTSGAQSCSPSGAGECCAEKTAGQCFEVHGRYGIYVENNGIWILRERRLVFTAGDEKLDAMINANCDSFGHAIDGDFVVCPVTPRQRGHLQYVCIRRYSHLKVVPRPK